MRPPQKLREWSQPLPAVHCEPPARLLLASPFQEDSELLRAIVGRGVTRCGSCADAMAHLTENPVPVVIAECELPDGRWQRLLSEISRLPTRPSLIIASRLADEKLWIEALNSGAYDVLPKPFEAPEVIRIVESACRLWNRLSPGGFSRAELRKHA
jgi:DNA-binding NtrC family response regulator